MVDRPASVDAYIESFPPGQRKILGKVRTTIRRALPPSEEVISYGIPTFKVNGKYLVYFAGWKSHVSVYPLPEVEGAVAARLDPYRSGRGTAKFKLSDPIPYDLIAELARLLAAQRAISPK